MFNALTAFMPENCCIANTDVLIIKGFQYDELHNNWNTDIWNENHNNIKY